MNDQLIVDYQLVMFQVILANQVHAKQIADFQCKMAIETENLKLDIEKVQKASEYLLKHNSYGLYFVTIYPNEPEKACASLLITYENQESCWIQSVYVREQHRRKGMFTSLFKKVSQRCKQKGIKSLQLYREKQNEKAKKTYESLGMYCNGNQFIGYEFVYGDPSIMKHFQQVKEGNFRIKQDKAGAYLQKQQQLKHISGESTKLNAAIFCIQENKLLGYCEYFTQFSDWRFGLIVYINHFRAHHTKQQTSLAIFVKYLLTKFELKVAAIRIIGKSDQVKRLKQIEPNLHLDVYDVMKIDL